MRCYSTRRQSCLLINVSPLPAYRDITTHSVFLSFPCTSGCRWSAAGVFWWGPGLPLPFPLLINDIMEIFCSTCHSEKPQWKGVHLINCEHLWRFYRTVLCCLWQRFRWSIRQGKIRCVWVCMCVCFCSSLWSVFRLLGLITWGKNEDILDFKGLFSG